MSSTQSIPQEQEHKRFKAYDLLARPDDPNFKRLLPEGHKLTLDTVNSILVETDNVGNVVELAAIRPIEKGLLEALLDNYPDYTPLPQLYSIQTGIPLAQSIEMINEAYEEGEGEIARPVRNNLSRLRVEFLRPLFKIDIKNINETGYALFPHNKKQPTRHNR